MPSQHSSGRMGEQWPFGPHLAAIGQNQRDAIWKCATPIGSLYLNSLSSRGFHGCQGFEGFQAFESMAWKRCMAWNQVVHLIYYKNFLDILKR